MANTGAGIGAFGAGFAKSLTDVLMGERERKRVETRRQEDRAYDVEKQKLSVMFPYMVENIENIDDDILAQEFPYHFGGKQGKTRDANAVCDDAADSRWHDGPWRGIAATDWRGDASRAAHGT